MSITVGRVVAYTSALTVPIAITYSVAWLQLPAFVFEHLIVLLVVGVAIPWGLGPAVVAALVSVVSDNMLLREPLGQPTISGYRDVLDLALFAMVAVVISSLVRRAHTARERAQEAAERERRAREDRDRLIATITHDLATPLSVLRNTVRLARRRDAAPHEIDLEQLLRRLDTASARATSILRMLSDAQAIESDGFDLNVASHDLAAIVTPIVAMMDRMSERHPLVVTLPQRPVTIHADAERIQRVLENLITNAIKYSPHGGPIEICVAAEDANAVIRVRDHGIGIAAEVLPRIFDRSYRAPGAGTHAPGLGLGLSIAAEVVHRHGGTIIAAPAAGAGTVFFVRLPLAHHSRPVRADMELGSVPLANRHNAGVDLGSHSMMRDNM